MKLLILAKNYESYNSGYYHQDWINAIKRFNECYFWGEGYSFYKKYSNINEIIYLAQRSLGHIDSIFIMSSWENQNLGEIFDPEPTISFENVSIPKVFFLNKEYKKLDEKIEYIKVNQINLVVSVLDSLKEKFSFTNFLHLPFAVDLDRVKNHIENNNKYIYDFAFTGGLHSNHLDYRFRVKQNFGLNKNFYKGKLLNGNRKIKIFWAEWGSKHLITRKSLLPTGEKYFTFLSNCKTFLSTTSAMGIIGTRFYELMILGSVPLIPDNTEFSTYGKELFIDKETCLYFGEKTRSIFDAIFLILDNEDLFNFILKNNKELVLNDHNYSRRISKLIYEIDKLKEII